LRPQIEEVVHTARLFEEGHMRLESTHDAGMLLQITHPFGDFTPNTESDESIVLLSAGAGITPMTSVLNRILEINPDFQLLLAHATQGVRFHAQQEDMAKVTAAMPNLSRAIFYEYRQEGWASWRVWQAHGRNQAPTVPTWRNARLSVPDGTIPASTMACFTGL
jgi:nitric oxide dioxygenase